ncbi:MAG TPA: BTAD domain-containing putative transcriptional regulator [Allosphingosinicella sp.]|nr:BTAD domain-containing putative transcriptional regulator [Allosphingosinicella sp.]
MQLRIYLAGGIIAEYGGAVFIRDADLRGRQARLAFAYLVCERGRSVARSDLAQVLWPDQLPAAFESGLNAIISRIRSAVRRIPMPEQLVRLDSTFGQVRLSLPGNAWVDLDASTIALDEAESAVRAGQTRRAFGPAAVAATITRRPFLPDDDCEWAVEKRQKLRRQCQRALGCLTEVWLACGEPNLAVEAADEAVALDPYRETAHRLLMRAHAAAGNRSEALMVYARLRETLAREVGTDPARETESLYLELLS